MALSSNYAFSSYAGLAYGVRGPAAYNFPIVETVVAGDGETCAAVAPMKVIAVGGENRQYPANGGNRNFTA